MKFRTKIEPVPFQPSISYGDHVVCLGSCFAAEMGEKLADMKISVDVNPAGILYNPASMSRIVELAIRSGDLQEAHLVFHDELWHSFLHHGEFSRDDKAEVVRIASEAHASILAGLRKAKWLILTLGTAHVYRHLERQFIVANCHKIPASEFQRDRLSLETCFTALCNVISLAREVNPALHVMCTVSPVRHVRDGLHQNQLSKATLLLAVEQACIHLEHVHYFPSYEICMDDLRDYRFYAHDLIHPSESAVDYIWEKLSEALLDESAIELGREVLKIRRAMRHRMIHGQKQKVRLFAEQQLKKIGDLSRKLPEGILQDELDYFTALLASD